MHESPVIKHKRKNRRILILQSQKRNNLYLKYPFEEVDLMMGDVQADSVLAKFVKNGEWDFHHVEAVRHNSLFALHDNENVTSKAG